MSKSFRKLDFFDLLYLTFLRLMKKPSLAIMMLCFFQTMLFTPTEARSRDIDELADLDFRDMDPSELSFHEVHPRVSDLTNSMQFEDVTEQYRRHLESQNNQTTCLPPPIAPGSFFKIINWGDLFKISVWEHVALHKAAIFDKERNIWAGSSIPDAEGKTDALIIKLSPFGRLETALQWQSDAYQSVKTMVVTPSENIAVVIDNNRNSFVFIFSPIGQHIKSFQIRDISSADINVDSDNSIWLAGNRNKDAILLKFSSQWKLLHTFNYNTGKENPAQSLTIGSQSIWLTGYSYLFQVSLNGTLRQAFKLNTLALKVIMDQGNNVWMLDNKNTLL